MAVSTVFDIAAATGGLKELYVQQVIEDLVYQDNPTLAMVPKFTEFGGKNKPVPIITTVSQGRSAVFANAQANQTATTPLAFALTRKRDYSIATIDNETMLASKTDMMSFLEGAKIVIDGAFRSITLSLASAMFRAGTGSIAAITTISTGVITLTNAADVVQFELNMKLNAAATDGGTPRAAAGYVIAIDRAAGTVTVSTTLGGSAGTPGSWQAADFLLVDGDSNAKISGFAAWIPPTAPSATLFYGVDRSADVTRLGGVRYDGSAQSIEEALIDGSMLLAREGGKPDQFVTSFASYAALEKSLGTKVQYIDFKGPAEIAFRGMLLNGANSTIKVFPDRSCQALTGYLLTMKTWKLDSLGDAPMILRYTDDNEMLRVYNADTAELRIGYYANMETNAPGWNENVKLGA